MKPLKQLKQLSAVAGLNLRLQLRDPAPTLVLTVIPLVLIPFMMPAFKAMLLTDGYRGVSGAEQAVPSIAVLFSFLAVQNIIDSFFNDTATTEIYTLSDTLSLHDALDQSSVFRGLLRFLAPHEA